MSMQEIIGDLRDKRNSLISNLMTEPGLMSFLEKHYGALAISAVKKEYLRRDLIELHKSPLDLVHYASLIKRIKDSGLTELKKEHPLFCSELDRLFKKYGVAE